MEETKPTNFTDMNEILKAKQKRELNKIRNQFKKDILEAFCYVLIAVGLSFISAPILGEFIIAYPTQTAMISIGIGLIGLYVLSRKNSN